MRFLEKIVVTVAVTISLFVAMPQAAHAAAWNPFGSVRCNQAADSAVCQDRNQRSNPVSGPNGIILRVANLIALVGGIASVIFIILAGLRMVTAGGSSEDVAGARRTLIYAVIGLVIILLARTIIGFVLGRI